MRIFEGCDNCEHIEVELEILWNGEWRRWEKCKDEVLRQLSPLLEVYSAAEKRGDRAALRELDDLLGKFFEVNGRYVVTSKPETPSEVWDVKHENR